MLYSVDGRGQSSPPAATPSTFPWLIVATGLHALYVAVAFYLVEFHGYDVLLAAGVAFGLMLAAGVVLRLAMPVSAGGWAVTIPLARLVRTILRPWLTPGAPPPNDHDNGHVSGTGTGS